VIVVDVNLLLYAHLEVFPQHARARKWWEALLNSEQEVALTTVSVFGFLRIATNARVFQPPLSVDAAGELIHGWLNRPNVRMLTPGPTHVDVVLRLLSQLGTASNLTTDAQLAAIAIEHQAEICSNDADFGRFPGLRWSNPLK
jgi:toxin-antitoxin system PIN domain toxin